MNRLFASSLLVILIVANVNAQQTRFIKKSFKVEEGKAVILEKFSGVSLKISVWDKDEIYFDLKAVIDCSDGDYELEYANSLAIENSNNGLEQIFRLTATAKESGTSIFGLFNIRLFYHFRKEIKGEIFLPRNNIDLLQVNYSDLYLNHIQNLKEINGRGNDILIQDCEGIERIVNPYGRIRIEKSSGNLKLVSKSTNIDIIEHNGDLFIESDYSKIKLANINGFINLENKSGEVEIRKANVRQLTIPYSKIELLDVNLNPNAELFISGRSANIYISNMKANLEIESDFAALRLRKVDGSTYINGKKLDIKGDELSGKININSNNSSIDIRFSNFKEGKISSSSAPINLHLLSDPQNLEINNQSAPVSLKIPAAYDGEFEIISSKGQISSDFYLNVSRNGTEMIGTSKGKSKNKIVISNSNSSIQIRK